MTRHLRPTTVQFLFALFAAICFVFVADNVCCVSSPLPAFDAEQAQRIYRLSTHYPIISDFARWTTDLGSGWPRTAVVVGVALLMLAERRWRLALFWAATQLLLREIVAVLKDAFERPRPSFPGSAYVAGGWSFPSGHAAGAMTTYGAIAFLIAMRWPDRWFRWPAIAGLCGIILLVGFSRMALGVHWFSDILGGYFLGLAYVALCMAALDFLTTKNTK
jgi:membrane-associated phospholipid phosphatase